MSREIKFRAWDKWESKMNYNLCHTPGDIEVTNINNFFEQEKDQYEFMQFTGLHDKNGKEIYEKDYIKATRSESSPDWECVEGVIDFLPNEGIYAIMSSDRSGMWSKILSHLYLDGWEKYEVVGNIYEHPELLQGMGK